MDYSALGFIIIALIAVLVVAPAIADSSWGVGHDLGLALVRTGEVLAGASLLIVMVELSRNALMTDERETAIAMTCIFVGLLIGLFSVEQHMRRSGPVEPSEPAEHEDVGPAES